MSVRVDGTYSLSKAGSYNVEPDASRPPEVASAPPGTVKARAAALEEEIQKRSAGSGIPSGWAAPNPQQVDPAQAQSPGSSCLRTAEENEKLRAVNFEQTNEIQDLQRQLGAMREQMLRAGVVAEPYLDEARSPHTPPVGRHGGTIFKSSSTDINPSSSSAAGSLLPSSPELNSRAAHLEGPSSSLSSGQSPRNRKSHSLGSVFRSANPLLAGSSDATSDTSPQSRSSHALSRAPSFGFGGIRRLVSDSVAGSEQDPASPGGPGTVDLEMDPLGEEEDDEAGVSPRAKNALRRVEHKYHKLEKDKLRAQIVEQAAAEKKLRELLEKASEKRKRQRAKLAAKSAEQEATAKTQVLALEEKDKVIEEQTETIERQQGSLKQLGEIMRQQQKVLDMREDTIRNLAAQFFDLKESFVSTTRASSSADAQEGLEAGAGADPDEGDEAHEEATVTTTPALPTPEGPRGSANTKPFVRGVPLPIPPVSRRGTPFLTTPVVPPVEEEERAEDKSGGLDLELELEDGEGEDEDEETARNAEKMVKEMQGMSMSSSSRAAASEVAMLGKTDEEQESSPASRLMEAAEEVLSDIICGELFVLNSVTYAAVALAEAQG
eukprot:g15963.t1